jgi:hypothetical protein
VEERRLRLSSLAEWAAAALCVVVLGWVLSVPVQRVVGKRVHAALVDVGMEYNDTPPGVPAGSTVVPVMLLLDGREIRHGELRAKVDELLPERFATRPPKISAARFGPRHTREYVVDGVRFFVVCEPMEPNGQMKVAGIYLP